VLDDAAEYALAAEQPVRERLLDRRLYFRLLRPPYPALGAGALRVLRVKESEAGTELVVGYERYERLPG
jgi:hypothetical protein